MQSQTTVFAVRVTSPPPIELSVLVGDVVHQLRSAVDHIAYELVRAAGNTPTRRTAFPALIERPRQLVIDGGVCAEALVAVDDVQPYQWQDSRTHPLSVLTELWNIDKHRTLHLTAMQVARTQIFLGASDGSSLVGGQFQAGPLGDAAIVGVFKFPGGQLDADLEARTASALHRATLTATERCVNATEPSHPLVE